MNTVLSQMLAELRALRASVDEMRARSAAPVTVSNEITTREALKIMRCNTNASLSALVKLFPSIRVRRGVYDKDKLRAALSSKEQIKRLNAGGVRK